MVGESRNLAKVNGLKMLSSSKAYFLPSGRTTIKRAISPSSVVTKPTVTLTFTRSLPSTRVSGLIQNDFFSAGLPSTLRETVIRSAESSMMGPENVSS